HYGNWEILNKLPEHTDMPVQALYKPLKNNLFNSFVYKKRTRYGARLLPATQALRILLREKQTHLSLFLLQINFRDMITVLPSIFYNSVLSCSPAQNN